MEKKKKKQTKKETKSIGEWLLLDETKGLKKNFDKNKPLFSYNDTVEILNKFEFILIRRIAEGIIKAQAKYKKKNKSGEKIKNE